MQGLWAKLLASAADPSCTNTVRKAFVTILSELEPLDAKFFEVAFTEGQTGHPDVFRLADRFQISRAEASAAIDNLERLGLVDYSLNWCATTALGSGFGKQGDCAILGSLPYLGNCDSSPR